MAALLWLAFELGRASAALPPLPVLALDQFPARLRGRVVAAQKRISREPANAAACGELGMLLHAYGQQAAALSAYARARALDPASFEWAYLSGVLKLALARAPEAIPDLREAVRLVPASLAARLRLADALLSAGEVEPARAAYRELT